ncbi:hypothetical protein PHLH8_47340 [Pseudomonas sp. Pc102]|nr:hypothetical protein PHLH8_47340 [Pseudomonas sp. Pc102]
MDMYKKRALRESSLPVVCLKSAMIFAVIGPLVACGIICLTIAFSGNEAGFLLSLMKAVLSMLIGLPLAYTTGLIPAFITGTLYALLFAKPLKGRWQALSLRVLAGATIGGAVSAGYYSATFRVWPDQLLKLEFGSALVMASLCTGGIVALLARGRLGESIFYEKIPPTNARHS